MAAITITEEVNALRATYTLPPRAYRSVQRWCAAHGVDLRLSRFTANDARHFLGVSRETMLEWRRLGILVGHTSSTRKVFDMSDLIEFVRRNPWLVDLKRMPYGPVRRALEITNQRDPWMRASEIAPLVPCYIDTVIKYAKLDRIAYHQRTGHHGAYMIRASSIPRIREILDKANRERVQSLGSWLRRHKSEAA